jgi:hypothetical protein
MNDRCEFCGFSKVEHYSALTSVADNPFGPTKTTWVLLCPSSTYHEPMKLEPAPPPVKPKRKLKVV